jgi:hypothetical protein
MGGDGQVFVIQPEVSHGSPLDVAGIDIDLSREEIVEIVREMRQRVNVRKPGRNSGRAVDKRATKMER